MNPICQNLLSTSIPLQYWQATIGGNNHVYWYSVKVDSSGCIYAAGDLNLGSYGQGIVAKYDSAGSVIWAKGLDGSANIDGIIIRAITVDSSGNIYCAGTAGLKAFAVKLNSSGEIQWQSKVLNVNSGFNAIEVDSSGNFYGVGNISSSPVKAFVIKLNSEGVIQWQNELTDSTFTVTSYSVLLDGSGNVYVSAETSNGNDVVLLKYDNSGVLQWQREEGFSSTSLYQGSKMVFDSSGNIYYAAASPGNGDYVHIYKYNSSGTVQWGKIVYFTNSDDLGSTSSAEYVKLAIDISGTIYLVCNCRQLDNQNNWGIAILTWNTSGVLQQATKLMYYNGSNGYLDPPGVDIDSSNSLYLAGGLEPRATSNFVGHITKIRSNLTGLGTFGDDLRYLSITSALAVEASNAAEAAGGLTSTSTSYTSSSTSYSIDNESLTTSLMTLP